jgi:ElaB/YqjD/DUF883 family membrane-anchored ribosome-binding protein
MTSEEMEMAYNRLSTTHGKLLNHAMDLHICINKHDYRKNGWIGIGFAVGLMVGVLIGMALK